MVIIVSSKNGCTYTLDPEHHAVLYYHPLNSDGSYETSFSAYAEVEWDELDEENVIEADRCVKMLKAEIELSGTYWRMPQNESCFYHNFGNTSKRMRA